VPDAAVPDDAVDDAGVAGVADVADVADETGKTDDDGVVVASARGVTADEVVDASAEEQDDAAQLIDLPEPGSTATDFWEGVGIDPVLISLPGGTGVTLRCYLDVDAEDREQDGDEPAHGDDPADEDQDESASDDDDDNDNELVDDDEKDEADVANDVDAIDGSPKATGDSDAAGKPVVRRSGKVEGESTSIEPRFLGHDGTILLFATAEALVAYVRSDASHRLTEAPGWAKVRKATTLDPTPELLNRYELDMVVDIARAGADGWGEQERQTLVLAGELARDAAAFCGLADMQAMLGPGSPLDALDDDLRKSGFLAKRRLRKYNPDQIALSWRRIIRELGTVVQHR